jgi:hypothetical protein
MKKKKIWLGALFGILCIGLFSAAIPGAAKRLQPKQRLPRHRQKPFLLVSCRTPGTRYFPKTSGYAITKSCSTIATASRLSVICTSLKPTKPGKASGHRAGRSLRRVKDQRSGHAQELAARGFLTLAFDPSFTERVPANPATRRPRTSTRKIFPPLWTFFPLTRIRQRTASLLGICGWGDLP